MPNPKTIPELRRYDGFYRRLGSKTCMTSFRIFENQAEQLKKDYLGNMSLVVRVLLEKYFADQLPDVKKEIEEIIGS